MTIDNFANLILDFSRAHPTRCFRILIGMLLTCLLIGCARQVTSPPTGKIVSWEGDEYERLSDIYQAQKDARREEIDFRIELPTNTFSPAEEIKVKAILTNQSGKDINVHKMNMPPRAHYGVLSGVRAVIVADDPTVPVEFEKSLLDFSLVQFGRPPPEAFVAIPAGRSYSEVLVLPPMESPLPVGNYSLFLEYAGRDFGADVVSETESHFLDFNAWLGEIQSNTATFKIVP